MQAQSLAGTVQSLWGRFEGGVDRIAFPETQLQQVGTFLGKSGLTVLVAPQAVSQR